MADARSLALHRAVAERIRRDPRIVERARERIDVWLASGAVHPYYCEAWRRVVARSTEEVAAFLESDDEHARELRQASPFAGILDPRERWRILKSLSLSVSE